MARYWDSNCVGCETCYNCGRRNKFLVYECDRCGNYGYDELFLVPMEDGTEICEYCYNEYLEELDEEGDD